MKLRAVDAPTPNKFVNVVRYFFTGSVGKGVTFKRVYVQSVYITIFINFLLMSKAVNKYIWPNFIRLKKYKRRTGKILQFTFQVSKF